MILGDYAPFFFFLRDVNVFEIRDMYLFWKLLFCQLVEIA
tara:strand:+ start:275 stop:394 length:120 start_codon:yes stop_codon:yes gene_type:complete